MFALWHVLIIQTIPKFLIYLRARDRKFIIYSCNIQNGWIGRCPHSNLHGCPLLHMKMFRQQNVRTSQPKLCWNGRHMEVCSKMSIRLVWCGKITCTWALFIVSTNILAIWAIPQIKHSSAIQETTIHLVNLELWLPLEIILMHSINSLHWWNSIVNDRLRTNQPMREAQTWLWAPTILDLWI